MVALDGRPILALRLPDLVSSLPTRTAAPARTPSLARLRQHWRPNPALHLILHPRRRCFHAQRRRSQPQRRLVPCAAGMYRVGTRTETGTQHLMDTMVFWCTMDTIWYWCTTTDVQCHAHMRSRGMTNSARPTAYGGPPGCGSTSACTHALRPSVDSRLARHSTWCPAGRGAL